MLREWDSICSKKYLENLKEYMDYTLYERYELKGKMIKKKWRGDKLDVRNKIL
jgi:hypothetical protein